MGVTVSRKRRDFRPVDKAQRVVNAYRNAKLDEAFDQAVAEDDLREGLLVRPTRHGIVQVGPRSTPTLVSSSLSSERLSSV